jgi:fucose permease
VTTDRRALAAVATQFFVNGFVYATIIPRYPEIRDRVGISTGGLGLALTMGSIAGLLGSVLAGGAVARVGTRRSVVLAQSLTILGVGVIGLATHPALLVAGLMAVLFFDVFADVAMNMQGSVLSGRRHTPVMNRLHGLWSLATVSGGLLATAVVALGVSVPAHFVVVALALLVVQGLVWPNLLPVDEPRDEPAARGSGTHSLASGGRGAAIALASAGAAAMAMEAGGGDWTAIRLTDDLMTSPEFAAAGFVAFTAGMTIGRLSGDWFQVRLGVHRLLLDASTLALIGLAVATLVGNQWLVLPGLLVGGLGISVQFPQLYDAAARFPGRPGQGFTAMLLGQRLAAVLTPLIIGTLAQTSALGVGEAMAVVVLPAAALTIGLSLLHAAGR